MLTLTFTYDAWKTTLIAYYDAKPNATDAVVVTLRDMTSFEQSNVT